MYEEEFDAFCEKWGHNRIDEERPGVRNQLHHFPVLYHTEEFRNIIGGYSPMGSGYDVEIDNRCGDLGFTKISPRNCFLAHKAYFAVKPEDV